MGIRQLVKITRHPAVLTATIGAVFFLIYLVEGKWQHMPFVALVVTALFGLANLVSRRLAFSTYWALAIVCMTTLMSVAKFRGKGFDLHVYDFAFTGGDPEALKFLAAEFSSLVMPVLVALVLAVIGLILIWRSEAPSQKSWTLRVSPLILAAIGLPLAYPIKWSEPRYFYYLGGFNASAFYISFLDIAGRFTDEPLVANLKNTDAAPAFTVGKTCDGMTAKPDIYVVLSESATNFQRNFPQLNIKHVPDNAFRSQDGKIRELRVETFGGGTWVSNLSFMTGLSSLDFGWRAPYLTIQLQNKIQQSIASVMKDCGYRTAAVLPMKTSFVNEGPFLRSIGFDDVLGYDEIGASLYNHRDTFYFGAANQFIDRHIAGDDGPLFLQVQTMFAHAPFDEPRAADIQFQDAPFSDDPALNEHIRRVYIEQNDFHDFIKQREKAHPDRPFIVVEFGDHQTIGTRSLADELAGGNSLLDRDSVAYKTHYSIHAYKYDLDMSAFGDAPLDIAFLGVSFMQAAGIPLPPMYEDLARLRDRCDGKFDDCKDRSAVNKHLNRRINSGLLTLPN